MKWPSLRWCESNHASTASLASGAGPYDSFSKFSLIDACLFMSECDERQRQKAKNYYFLSGKKKDYFFCFSLSLSLSLSLQVNAQAASTTMRSWSGTFFQSGVTGKSGVLASALSTAALGAALLDADAALSFEPFFEAAVSAEADIVHFSNQSVSFSFLFSLDLTLWCDRCRRTCLNAIRAFRSTWAGSSASKSTSRRSIGALPRT